MIPKKQYIRILRHLPILCVDIILRNNKGRCLLIKRANQPKKNRWWVIGGRVLKGESLEKAAVRKVMQETGQRIENLRLIGCYELINGVNSFGTSFSYHTVSVVFTGLIDSQRKVKLDKQSLGFKFSKKLPRDFNVKPLVS